MLMPIVPETAMRNGLIVVYHKPGDDKALPSNELNLIVESILSSTYVVNDFNKSIMKNLFLVRIKKVSEIAKLLKVSVGHELKVTVAYMSRKDPNGTIFAL